METHRLKLLHRAGAGGLEICHARAAILDVLLRSLWDTAKGSLSAQAQKEFPPLALVALGGYGRASSIRTATSISCSCTAARSPPAPGRCRTCRGSSTACSIPLWDIGLKVGHSVRSIEDCVKMANSDMQSKTSLIEARLIAGDEALFEKFQKTLVAKCVEGHEEEYIAMRIEDQAARRAKFGNSACMQEPNLKNGCGGLRDFQNLLWMAFFKYRTRSLKDLQAHELIERERAQATRGGLRFPAARAHGDALPRQPRDGCAEQEPAAGRRPQPRLPRAFAQQADREVHARRLHATRATSS